MRPRPTGRVAKDVAALLERDPGFRCAYCSCRLQLPLEQAGSTEQEWEAAGWELYLLSDGEPVWQSIEDAAPVHRDHVEPRGKGGPDHLDNLVLSCDACNATKNALPLILFLAKRAGVPRFRSVGGDHADPFAKAWAC